MAEVRQGRPLPVSRQRPDWRTGPQVTRGGKLVDVEILGESSIDIAGDVTLAGTTTIASEDWVAPTLLNSWVDYGTGEQTTRYRKDASGTVWVQGVIKSGTTTSGTNVFLLPAGYRPAANLNIVGVANNAFCNMKMQSTGYLETRSGWSATFTAFNFSFPAA